MTNNFGSNFVYNETFEENDDIENQEKRLQFAVSAAFPGNRYAVDGTNFITLTGIRPPSLEDVVELPLGAEMMWTDPKAWKFDPPRIPRENDTVVIDTDMNIIYDVALGDEVKLESLEVNGKLTFLDGADRELKSHSVWVRAGELNIGSAAAPFQSKATITLLGDNTQFYWSFSDAIEAGNKNFVVTGNANIYGTPRTSRSRLLETVYRTERKIKVEPLMDWQVGDEIGIAATNTRTMDFDICKIKSHVPGDGAIECEEDLDGYHFGAFKPTTKDFGVDMRAEVMLLERNVKIRASTDDIGEIIKDVWGCRILVADFFEPNRKYRTGNLIMDNAQVFNCSQKQTWKSAVKFHGAFKGNSKISNSVLNTGKGIGVMIQNSVNVELKDNVIADFVKQGIWVRESQNVILDGNWVHHIRGDDNEPDIVNAWPVVGNYEIGGITASEANSKMIVKNNVVSGAYQVGFHYKP